MADLSKTATFEIFYCAKAVSFLLMFFALKNTKREEWENIL